MIRMASVLSTPLHPPHHRRPRRRRTWHVWPRRRSSAAILLAAVLSGCAGMPRLPAATAVALQPAPPAPPPARGAFPEPDLVFTLRDGTRLPARVWMPPPGVPLRRVILALHGYQDSRDAWELPAPRFAAAGMAVIAPDQRGFGATADRGHWAGLRPMLDDAVELARDLHARYPTIPLVMMGESMGGAITLCVAARPDRLPIDAYVALAPAVWGRAQMGVLLRTSLFLAATLAPGWQVSGNEVPVHVVASDNRSALIRLSRDPLTLKQTNFAGLHGLVDLMDAAQRRAPEIRGRVLVLDGAHDELVPPAATAELWRNLPPQIRRAYYWGGYHLLLRDRARAAPTGDIIAWLDHPDRWLPSGADIAAAAWFAGRSWEDEPAPLLPADLDDLAGDDGG